MKQHTGQLGKSSKSSMHKLLQEPSGQFIPQAFEFFVYSDNQQLGKAAL
jgi:hypothetical protein